MDEMIQIHYRHLPMGCRYATFQVDHRDLLDRIPWTNLPRSRYRTMDELQRAQREGIRIREDSLVWTTPREMRRALLKEARWQQRS